MKHTITSNGRTSITLVGETAVQDAVLALFRVAAEKGQTVHVAGTGQFAGNEHEAVTFSVDEV